jgi:vacuolar protein sorting-associated protein 13A/C
MLPDSKTPSLNVFAPKKLELDISCAFLEYAFSVLPQIKEGNLRDLMQRSGQHSPFTIQNRTGYPIYVWADSSGDGTDTELFKMGDGEDKPWHFDDWSIMRKVMIS